MKKHCLAAAILALASMTAFAQGTVSFLNSALSKVKLSTGPDQTVDCPVGTTFGIYWGENIENLTLAEPTVVCTSPGLFNGGAVYPLAGSSPGQQVFLKVAGWLNLHGPTPATPTSGEITCYGESSVVSVNLGLTPGPGSVIWQSAAGTNPNRAKPFVLCVPEPSTLALGCVALLAGGGWIVRRRACRPQSGHRRIQSSRRQSA